MIAKIARGNSAAILLTCILLTAAGARAGENPDKLRALNARVLELHAALGRADAGRAAQIRAESSQVFAERAAALKALIRESPAAALGLAFPHDLTVELAGKFPASAGLLEKHGTWQGRSEHVVLD